MNRVWTPLCARMGIDVPIFGFAHDVQVVAAITNAGGYGVYGATRRFPHEIKEELKQIRALVGDKPFGVDLVLPPGMPTHNSRDAIEAEIPKEHRDFVKQLTDRYEVPPASAPGMRTRFIRSAEIEHEQIRVIMESDVDMMACGIGAPRDVVEFAARVGLALVGDGLARGPREGLDQLVEDRGAASDRPLRAQAAHRLSTARRSKSSEPITALDSPTLTFTQQGLAFNDPVFYG